MISPLYRRNLCAVNKLMDGAVAVCRPIETDSELEDLCAKRYHKDERLTVPIGRDAEHKFHAKKKPLRRGAFFDLLT